MAPSPLWSGNLRLSLVLVPVKLFPAMSTAQVSDSRTEAMLESIRLDALGHWEN
jgi:non-homologous end joining protein Ku